jgi:hypothetical protein
MRRRAVVVVAVLATVLAGCSDGDRADEDDRQGSTTMTTLDRPEGPAAELEELTGGKGISPASIQPVDLEAAGFAESEWMASGTATSYKAVGELPVDGTFELAPDVTADYATRIVVRRPADAADFNGTVLLEWLNVTAGLDASPDWSYAAAEVLRRGYAWVGVSAQQIGIQGGKSALAVAGVPQGGIKAGDPARYGALSHPGDAFSFDIYTQVGRALREPETGHPLEGLAAERVLALGESQAAYQLTTYVNGVQPLTKAFDGFLVHSRGGSAGPLGEPGQANDLVSAMGGPGVRIRTDGGAPVIVLETEGDVLGVLGYHRARQPDAERFRLWEVAGSAHADAFQVGAAADMFDCGGAINDGPQRFLVRSAIRHLDRWVRTGVAPPEAPRLEVDESGAVPVFVRDEDGIVEGGIRTPPVDVPTATLSGEPWEGGGIICILFGKTVPFPMDRIRELYPTTQHYLDAYEAATDEAIDAGWVLEEDREDLMSMAASVTG